MLWFTDGWKRSPPLYGPIELLNCTRQARLTRTLPSSSSHETRKIMMRSGSVMRSRIWACWYSGCSRIKGITVSVNSWTA